MEPDENQGIELTDTYGEAQTPYQEWSQMDATHSAHFQLTQALVSLRRMRGDVGRSEDGRTLSIAITDLETAMLRLGYEIN
jgi:hypothetical protein